MDFKEAGKISEIPDVQTSGTELCGTCLALGRQNLSSFVSLALPSLCNNALYKICVRK